MTYKLSYHETNLGRSMFVLLPQQHITVVEGTYKQ